MERYGNVLIFWGTILLLSGWAIYCAVKHENKKIPWRVWDTSEKVWRLVGAGIALTGVGFFVYFFASGCGTSLPQPTDPVTVEVVACEPTLGGTPGQYLQLKAWRTEVGICEAAMAEESVRQAIRNFAERDVDRLGQEFDVYRARGRTDCYCGPVCQEMTKFLLEARANGLFCGP
jgi:hypothetical protein